MAKAYAGRSIDAAIALCLLLAAVFMSLILSRTIQMLGACLLPFSAVFSVRGVRGCKHSDRIVAGITLVISMGMMVLIIGDRFWRLFNW